MLQFRNYHLQKLSRSPLHLGSTHEHVPSVPGSDPQWPQGQPCVSQGWPVLDHGVASDTAHCLATSPGTAARWDLPLPLAQGQHGEVTWLPVAGGELCCFLALVSIYQLLFSGPYSLGSLILAGFMGRGGNAAFRKSFFSPHCQRPAYRQA